MIIRLIAGLIKNILYELSQCVPKPYDLEGDINVKVVLSNYETKAGLRKTTGINTSNLAAKSDLASIKAEIDKINVDKLKTVPVDLSKLRNVTSKLY